VRAILSKSLITGLKLDSDASPDPICEPCLAGKMHALPFRSSLSHNRSPLELVHTNLHGPLPVATHSGYKYWITFIDDATRFRAVYLLKAKSEAFEAFKVYKSWAENQLGVKLRALQDDKGGEYISNACLAFTEAAGIERRHSTRNRPQQIGLAERANRTMGERITAMLSESRLPPSFWGECISSMVHVWNKLPTASLPGSTPFEAFYKRKPDHRFLTSYHYLPLLEVFVV
jgi:transposase InsO family protein